LEELERFEDAKLKALVDRDIYERMVNANAQKHDLSVRRFIVLNAPDLLDPAQGVDNNRTKLLMSPVFTPESIEELTIFNCFFLRFPDYSPNWPMRSIKTDHEFRLLVKVREPSVFTRPSNLSSQSKISFRE
jgi:hypothetical protein